MWSIGGIELILTLSGDLMINVSSNGRRLLLVRLLQWMLNAEDFTSEPGHILLMRNAFLYRAGSNNTGQVYIPYMRGKSFYGLYIDEDIFMLMSDAANTSQQREREILNKLNELGE